MALEKILILDDELIIRKTLQEQLQKRRFTVAAAATIEKARRYLEKDDFDIVFADLRLPDGDGAELLEEAQGESDSPLIVMMTGYGSVESAVNCMRAGAFDYIIKPFSANQIEIILQKAEEFSHLLKVNQFYSKGEDQGSELIGDSQAIEEVRGLTRRVAPKNATVLILGESGTGKELVANEIHRASRRSKAPFIKVNCAAILESLIESEFFGHEHGAFTGAIGRHEGRFELAHGGTILLDEVSEISPSLQAKLLRVLQEHEFERVGGTKTIKVDVRVIATTNRDLTRCVAQGEFREDLFYRLNVFPIVNPPLRERKSDIPILAEHFVNRFSRQHGVRIKRISAAAKKSLAEHNWPGNVRELQNSIERAVIMSEMGDVIEPRSLGLIPMAPTEPEEAKGGHAAHHPLNVAGVSSHNVESNGAGAFLSMEELEREHIIRSLEVTGGNRSRAARLLKISSRTLRNKLRHYSLEEDRTAKLGFRISP